MKMVITLISHGIFFQILYYVFKHCPATGMKKCDEAIGNWVNTHIITPLRGEKYNVKSFK